MIDDRKVLHIFEQALDVSLDQRAGFLEEACGGDEQLRRSVESLLQIHEGSETFLPENQTPAPNDPSPVSTGFARFVQDEFRNLLGQHPAAREQLSEEEIPACLGSYTIGRVIGRGGMGVVYEARHQTMRRRVALKVLRTSHTGQGHQLERFLREARSAGRLHHSNIVPVFEVGADRGLHFYAMQFIHGDNLDVVIEELRQLRQQLREQADAGTYEETHDAAHCLLSGHFETFTAEERFDPQADSDETGRISDLSVRDGPPEPAIPDSDSSSLTNLGRPDDNYFHRIARLGLQVAEALSYAHDHGILHRDIKPSNLILDRSGTVWVTDFGLATSEGEELTETGDVVGTLRYMAPERFRGEADERSDIYSLGLTLYELCTLRSAFDQKDRAELVRQVTHEAPPRPSQLAPSIPRDLETIISRCIAREPAARYSNAHKVADDLRLFLEDRPILARRVSLTEKTWRWCRRNPGLASMVGMVMVLLVLVTCGSVVFAWQTREYNEQLIEQKQLAEQAQKYSEQAFEAERIARLAETRALEESKANLYRALYRQVQAERQNPLTSRHADTVAALKEAARLLPTVPALEESIDEERFALRTEAAAIYGQTDLMLDHEKLNSDYTTTSVSFSPDYGLYAISTGFIEVYRAGDRQPFLKLTQYVYRATDFEFSEDGRYLAALHRIGARYPRYVRVWDLKNEAIVLDVETPVTQIRLSAGSAPESPPHLAIVSTESTVTVYPECDVERRKTRDFGHQIRGADFSSDGSTLLVVGDSPSLVAWTVAEDTTEATPLSAPAESIACGTEQNTVAIGLRTGDIQILDLEKNARTAGVLRGHSNSVFGLALSPDNTLVVSSSWDGSTRLWDVAGSRELKRLESSRLRSGFSTDSNLFSCIFDNREVLVYRVVRNHPKRVYVDQYRLPRRNDVAIHPTNPRIAVTATSGYVEFWDLQTGRIIKPLKTERAFEAKLSRDGSAMLTSGRHGLRLWNLSVTEAADDEIPSVSCTLERTLTDHDTYQMDCTADLERVAYVTPDENVIIADTANIAQKRVLESNEGFLKVALSPNGKWLATVTNRGRHLAVWNADKGDQIEEYGSHERVTGIAFSPDNRWLAANGVKHRFLWRVSDATKMFQTPSEERFPGDISFSPDGRLIAMPHNRYNLELIDSATFRPLIQLTSTLPRDLETVVFSADGRKLMTTRGTDFEVWDMIELRQKLRELNLDWEDSDINALADQ